MKRFLTASNQKNVVFFSSKSIFFLLLSAELYDLNLIKSMVIFMFKSSAPTKLVQCLFSVTLKHTQNDTESKIKALSQDCISPGLLQTKLIIESLLAPKNWHSKRQLRTCGVSMLGVEI